MNAVYFVEFSFARMKLNAFYMFMLNISCEPNVGFCIVGYIENIISRFFECNGMKQSINYFGWLMLNFYTASCIKFSIPQT